MVVSVFGFRSGIFDVSRMRLAALHRKPVFFPTGCKRDILGYSVTGEGDDFLNSLFNVNCQNFVLLNDIGIEACESLGFALGQRLGEIEAEELGGAAIKFGPYDYWDERVF